MGHGKPLVTTSNLLLADKAAEAGKRSDEERITHASRNRDRPWWFRFEERLDSPSARLHAVVDFGVRAALIHGHFWVKQVEATT
jgi:hypothetical protein